MNRSTPRRRGRRAGRRDQKRWGQLKTSTRDQIVTVATLFALLVLAGLGGHEAIGALMAAVNGAALLAGLAIAASIIDERLNDAKAAVRIR